MKMRNRPSRPSFTPEAEIRLATRAILILLVVIGHNKIFRGHFYYSGYILIYSFHVGSFFLLSMLSPPRKPDWRALQSMLSHLYRPFLVFTLGYAVLYLPIYLSTPEQTLRGWMGNLVLAAGLATAPFLDEATGLKLLWFLPAFMSFCLLYNVYGQLRSAARRTAWAVAALGHATIAMLPPETLTLVPFGAAVTIFLFFPSLVFASARSLLDTRYGPPIVMAGFAFCSVLIVTFRMEVILSDFRMPSASTPAALALCDMQLLLGALSCMVFARMLAGFKLMTWIGSRSLQIYLLHAPFNLAIAAILNPILPWPLSMCLTMAATLIAAAFTARLIEATPAGPLIFSVPRRPLPALHANLPDPRRSGERRLSPTAAGPPEASAADQAEPRPILAHDPHPG
ncbi:acyltransferase [Novosphingobium resinovorum]|uniref:acyltransferase n=1 Tax=Novosphingobium resinovorum TaxID=158500 RepID=UPI002ED19B0B|nr:acyltransferase [Novosphingobium resinovorum]